MSQTFVALLLFCCIYCITGQTTQTDCQRARTRAQASTAILNLVPNCQPNGDYSALQCHSNSTFCQCWKPDGSIVSSPSRKTKRCECHLQRHQVRSSGGPQNPNGPIGAYVPQCAENGGYAKKQCHSSTGMCWCVNDTGAQVGQQVRGTLSCP